MYTCTILWEEEEDTDLQNEMTLSKGAESAESDVTALVSSSPTSQDGESNESGSKALDSGDEDNSHGYYSKKRFSRKKRSVYSNCELFQVQHHKSFLL